MKCSQCAYWDKPDADERMGRCQLTTSDGGQPIHSESLCVVQDTEDYHAWLETSPDFGCIQFLASTAQSTAQKTEDGL